MYKNAVTNVAEGRPSKGGDCQEGGESQKVWMFFFLSNPVNNSDAIHWFILYDTYSMNIIHPLE